MNSQIRTAITHAGTGIGGMIAATAFLAQHKVDLYAIWDQMNVVVASVAKLIAMVTPIATGAYAVYKSAPGQKLLDLLTDDPVKTVAAAQALPVTPQSVAVAEALSKQPAG